MSDPARGLQSSLSPRTSLLRRIRENLQSLRAASRIHLVAPPSTNAAPIHLLEISRAGRLPAQTGSTALHIVGFATLLTFFAHPSITKIANQIPIRPILSGWSYSPPPSTKSPSSSDHLGKAGGGGNDRPLPPKAGQLAPLSSMVLSQPRLPDGRVHPLPETVAIYDPAAPVLVTPAKNLGLPWMDTQSDSAGPGERGSGNNRGNSMGRNGLDGDGEGHVSGPYTVAASYVSCKYCPDPQYSDEARNAKLQGHITLRVLVSADGRAEDVQIVHGLGLGLDRNAIDAVRHWQFLPARDSAHRPIASWITIETVFRLF